MALETLNIYVNVNFVEELGGGGVYWSETGGGRIKSKFEEAIERFIGKDEDDEWGVVINKFREPEEYLCIEGQRGSNLHPRT